MASLISGGGLDVDFIVSQLILAERAPARALERARSDIRAKETQLSRFESNLRNLKTAVEPLRTSDAVNPRSLTSSDDSVVGGSVKPGTATGTYDIVVDQLATTNAHASGGFDSLDDTLEAGTFDITVDGVATEITAAATDTLEDLRDAINAADAGVQASVLFDGSKYRLSVTSETSGLDGAITIDNFSDIALRDALDFGETIAARNAELSVNGLDITRSSNSIDDVIDGATIDLKEGGGAQAQIDIGFDTEASVEKIRHFVDAYNAISTHMREQIASAGKEAGPLANLSSVRRTQDRLRSLVTGGVDGLDSDITSLRQLGVELQNDGSIVFDESKFKAAVETGDAGHLFETTRRATHDLVAFSSATSVAKPGTYEVFVTQAAEQASVQTTQKVPNGGLKQDETLTFTRGEISVDIELAEDDTADDIVDKINAGLAGTGINLTAAHNNRKLAFTSDDFGEAATVDVVSNIDANGSTRVGTAGLSDAGLDVAGTIGGEAATGSGKTLTAAAGDPSGIAVKVHATADDIDPGGSALGDVVFSEGIGEKLYKSLEAELSSKSGLAAERSGLDRNDRLLQDRIESIDRRLADRQVFLTSQFSRADAALRQMNSLMQQLGNQFGG